MKVLIWAQFFPPEVGGGTVLLGHLAEDLAARGHGVTVVTGFPNYPTGIIPEQYRGKLGCREEKSGVRILRTFIYASPKRTLWRRILSVVSFAFTSFWGAMLSGPQDVVLCFQPFPLGLVVNAASALKKVPIVYRIEDIYPDQAIAVGLIKSRWIIRFLASVEKLIYKGASRIIVISNDFEENLLQKEVPVEKLRIIPDWIDTDVIVPMDKKNAFREQHAITGRFVALHSGSMGYTANMDILLECATLLREEQRIQFVVAGEGVQKPHMMNRAAALSLSNIRFLPYQPQDLLPYMLAAADVGLVTLNYDSSDNFPSKTLGIMASARPVLAAAEQRTELARIVREAACGVCIEPGDAAGMAESLLMFLRHPDQAVEAGIRGRQYVEEHFSRRYATVAHEKILRECLNIQDMN
jgi:colanic acid biosynthesis glycosyl transferase WcaI